MTTATTYTTREATARAGANYRRVDYWVRLGYAPCTKPANGSGSRRRFTDRDVFVLRALAVVSDAEIGDSNGDVFGHVGATALRMAEVLPESLLDAEHHLNVRLTDHASLSLTIPAVTEAVSA